MLYAIKYGFPNIVKSLSDNGCSVDIIDRLDNQSLWCAVFNARGDCDIVRMLMQKSPNVTQKNKVGRSQLDFAIQISEEELVQILKV